MNIIERLELEKKIHDNIIHLGGSLLIIISAICLFIVIYNADKEHGEDRKRTVISRVELGVSKSIEVKGEYETVVTCEKGVVIINYKPESFYIPLEAPLEMVTYDTGERYLHDARDTKYLGIDL